MNSLQRTLDWFKKVIPDPGLPAFYKGFQTQLGVHFEEVAEMINEISSNDQDTERLLNLAQSSLESLAEHLKKSTDAIHIESEDLHDYFDSICDQLVTATGCAAYIGGDLVGALNAVNRSNFSKFDENENPIFDENRKVKKGPNYKKADLHPFLPA